MTFGKQGDTGRRPSSVVVAATKASQTNGSGIGLSPDPGILPSARTGKVDSYPPGTRHAQPSRPSRTRLPRRLAEHGGARSTGERAGVGKSIPNFMGAPRLGSAPMLACGGDGHENGHQPTVKRETGDNVRVPHT